MCQNMSCIYIAEHFSYISDPAIYIDLINRKRANSRPRISACIAGYGVSHNTCMYIAGLLLLMLLTSDD
jgi:hypothetical protein